MSAYLYDEALLKKLQNWTKSTNLTITGVSETRRMFSVLADKSDDKPLQLPLVTLNRNGGFTILNKQKQPLTFNALPVMRGDMKTVQLNAIPIQINYQIDIYTRYFQEADEFARNFVFNIINYPKVNIEIPYLDTTLTHDSNIRLANDVEDNSDIAERLISGQFSRLTLQINIDDAYLFDVKVRDNYLITEIVNPDNTVTVVNHRLSFDDKDPQWLPQ